MKRAQLARSTTVQQADHRFFSFQAIMRAGARNFGVRPPFDWHYANVRRVIARLEPYGNDPWAREIVAFAADAVKAFGLRLLDAEFSLKRCKAYISAGLAEDAEIDPAVVEIRNALARYVHAAKEQEYAKATAAKAAAQ